MGNYFHTPLPLEERLRIAIYNKDRTQMDELLSCPEFSKQTLGVNVYVEAVQKLWDWQTISRLCDGARLENIATTLATSVICGATVEYKTLFEYLSAAAQREGKLLSEASKTYALPSLFMFEAFLENKCFIPNDTRPLRYFVHRELRKNSTATAKHIR
eukprot:CAMPEP_0176411512 /NCGR_PEP_ID=MMETSP0127-20121128/3644_1 /TAXON_ID=938130 /ORGANISM="Platyophrya macrostoma, Strain WH" /LENGTH=157 /DNA_ID=CAMNT_0017791109 /DNA_START=24 /DNA_END=493 /DNA_ORIENTATION=-